MALSFPSNPSVEQIYSDGTNSWRWDGTVWKKYNPVPFPAGTISLINGGSATSTDSIIETQDSNAFYAPLSSGIAIADGTGGWDNSLAIPAGGLVGVTATQTLTNKRVTPRVETTTSSATPTINTDNVDMYGLTAQAVDITSFTTNLSGTPTNGQRLWIYIVGTGARAITWGAKFESSTVNLPTTTISTNRIDVGFVWNAASSVWRCVATA